MSSALRCAGVGFLLGVVAMVLSGDAGRAAASTAPASAEPAAADVFQWYAEFDDVDYFVKQPTIERTVPRGRVAVIDFVTFQALGVHCPLTGVGIATTFRGLWSLHNIVGVVDLASSDTWGHRYGMSQPAKVFAGGGSTVTIWINADAGGASCPGSGADFTVVGHLLPPR